MFVIPSLYGGLCNQLFQLAAAMGFAARLGRKVVVRQGYRGPTMSVLSDRALESVVRGYFSDDGVSGLIDGLPSLVWRDESCFDFSPIEDTSVPVIVSQGYFQNAFYFSDVQEKVGEVFSPFCGGSVIRDAIGIHVRMGDYLSAEQRDYHPVVSKAYVREAVQVMLSVGKRGRDVVVFSDDVPAAVGWVREAVCGLGCHVEAVEAKMADDPVASLAELSRFRCFIGSNSTFSWWGSFFHRFLPDGEDHYVCLPSHWMGGMAAEQFAPIYHDVTRGELAVI